MAKIYVKKGKDARTPWNDISTSSAVETEMLTDIKYADGWDLIYYIPEDQLTTEDDCYLVFHNRYTGILKAFYYSEGYVLNNNGMWRLSTSSPTSMFAFNKEYTDFASISNSDTIYVSNSTTCKTNGFPRGWNCFQIELAYDPKQSGRTVISALNRNTSYIELSGSVSTTTEGLIYSSIADSKFEKGMAKLFGKTATHWVEDRVTDKTIPGLSAQDILNGAEALFTKGAAGLIGSVTGLFSKSTNTTHSLQLTTNGEFKMDGEIVSEMTGLISPLNFSIDPNLVGRLGVWGLGSKPVIPYSPYAIYRQNQSYSNGYTVEYEIHSGSYSYAGVIINPDLKPFLKSHSTSTKIYSSDKTTTSNAFNVNYGVYGRHIGKLKKVYDGLYEPNIGLIADVAFKGREEGEYLEVGKFDPPVEVYIPNVPNGPVGCIPNFTFNSDYVAIVSVNMVTENGDIAQSVHKCTPLHRWDYDRFNDGIYRYLYPNEPVY